eukprot:gene47529-biopygen36907
MVTTPCCKSLGFLNAPGSIYGDVVNKYTASSAPSTYIYTYVLSAAPRSTVTVTPIFKNLDYSPFYGMTAVVPAFKIFTSHSGSIQGSFYITASALLEGQFYVFLNTTGADALDYTTTSSLFQLLKSTSPIPAPKLLACQFSDSGSYAYISFDTPTDRASLTANLWPCNSTISSCTNLTVDATLSSGSGGRDWQSVDWRVDGYTGSLSDGTSSPIYPYN